MAFFSQYIIYCPKCGQELNWYSSSTNKDTFKCLNCEVFLDRINKSKILVVTDDPKKSEEYYRKRGMLDEEYNGIPTSYFYKPKLIKIIEKFMGKR